MVPRTGVEPVTHSLEGCCSIQTELPGQILRLSYHRPMRRAFPFLIIACAALITYAPSLRNGFVIWDDDTLITGNPLVQSFSPVTVKGAFTSYDPELYVPLTIVSYQVEHSIVGNEPLLYHIDNLLLHIITSCLVFLLLQLLGIDWIIALLGGLLFAVHPINSEAVSWMSARKDLLAGVFGLASLVLYLKYQKNSYVTLSLSKREWSFAFFLLALLSKASAITLPLVMLLIDWFQQKKTLRESLIKKTALSSTKGASRPSGEAR